MPNSPRAYWPCGSVLEKHAHRQTRTERFWLGVANADGKIWPKLKMVKMEFSLYHQYECNCTIQHVIPLFQTSLGGNLRFALTASAPISPTVLSFLRATLGCLIFEGYGQTECTAGCTFSMPGDWSTGMILNPFPPLACVFVLVLLLSSAGLFVCFCKVMLALLYLALWWSWWTSQTWTTTLRTERERWGSVKMQSYYTYYKTTTADTFSCVRFVSVGPVCSKAIWRTQKRQLKPWTVMAGCTVGTWASGFQ